MRRAGTTEHAERVADGPGLLRGDPLEDDSTAGGSFDSGKGATFGAITEAADVYEVIREIANEIGTCLGLIDHS